MYLHWFDRHILVLKIIEDIWQVDIINIIVLTVLFRVNILQMCCRYHVFISTTCKSV